jgi:CubicO group peptidase (beta-lactamase class C family)
MAMRAWFVLGWLCSPLVVSAAEPVWPAAEWIKVEPAEVGMAAAHLEKARDYALTGGGSGYITRHGRLVMVWGDPTKKYDLKSTSKSIGVTALGLAVGDGKMALSDKAARFHPGFGLAPVENPNDWLEEITLQHLATQTAGFDKPGGYEKLVFRPGSKWHYSDGGPNWLAECVTLVYQRDIEELMFDRVFSVVGIEPSDLHWRKNQYRPHEIEGIARCEFGSGVHANVDAMARIGYLYLRQGKWRDKQILPTDFVQQSRKTVPEVVGLDEHNTNHGNASDHYGLLWWNNADGAMEGVPSDAFWSWGLYESLIVVIPSLDIVVSRAGRSWNREWSGHYDVLKPFFQPIVASVKAKADETGSRALRRSTVAPYPRSDVITGISWAPLASVTRKAEGSDNWPLTWADDGEQYTAFGDGWGFKPVVEKKLSMGFARIVGGPDRFRGINIRSAEGETIGQGAEGVKASGILMVEGVLYLWVRNAGNSRLGWSTDLGQSWEWSDWKFTTSFGCPTFLNFGKNYAGARDGYVYVYSLDSETAYDPADHMVLARVPKNRVRERAAYEFFQRLDSTGCPTWTPDIDSREPVFTHPGRCYRSGVTYNAGLKRYFWCQIHPESTDSRGPRYEGSFGIYEAPEPWGPWTTVYFTAAWDIGPGETSSFPTKWMSDDGKTMYLVFSGNDYFSVRKATLETR